MPTRRSGSHLRFERVGRHAMLWLLAARGDPPVLSSEALDEAGDLLKKLAADPDLRSVTLRSEGASVFLAGHDLKEEARLTPAEGVALTRRVDQVASALEALPFPSVAAVEGNVTGAGCDLMLNFDVVVTTQQAHFTFSHGRFGVIPAWATLAHLIHRVGARCALALLTTSRPVPAAEAHSLGLVDLVVDDREALEDHIAKLQASFELVSPAACRAAKTAIRAIAELPAAKSRKLVGELQDALTGGPDHAEGLKAHFRRRAPRWLTEER